MSDLQGVRVTKMITIQYMYIYHDNKYSVWCYDYYINIIPCDEVRIIF